MSTPNQASQKTCGVCNFVNAYTNVSQGGNRISMWNRHDTCSTGQQNGLWMRALGIPLLTHIRPNLNGQLVPARWIVGADGGQSAVRRWAGLEAFLPAEIVVIIPVFRRIAPSAGMGMSIDVPTTTNVLRLIWQTIDLVCHILEACHTGRGTFGGQSQVPNFMSYD